MDTRRVLQARGLSPRRYLAAFAAPTVGGGALLALAVLFLLDLPGVLRYLVPAVILAVSVAMAALWPLALHDRRRTEINEAVPFFMTHFGVLSTSNLPRAEIIRVLGERREYGALAEEMRRIHGLVENWNLSLPEACRVVSKTTPSTILADFLERLAHAVQSGQDLEGFLRAEQSVVMKEYGAFYEASLYRLEQLKELYLSVMMSGVFLVVFAVITPVITGSNPARLLTGILAFFALMEGLFLFLVKLRAPNDRLWHGLDVATRERGRIRAALAASALLAVALAVGLSFTALPFQVGLALAVSPFAAAGVYAERVERRIRRREQNYGAFVRSLGASASARGGGANEVLRKLTAHNFGPLTEMVKHLYARLAWRIDETGAWRRFAADSGSNLVAHFNDMFIAGLRAGGKAHLVGEIISENVVRILNLRTSRASTAGTFRGVLLGFTAAMAFTLFIGVGLLDALGSMFSSVNLAGDLSPVAVHFDMSAGQVGQWLVWLMLFHALAAALVLKVVDGGGYPAGLGNFVLMTWIAVAIALVSARVMHGVFRGSF